MGLTELIDEEHGMITVTGTREEIRRLAYTLESTISKGHLREELEELIAQIERGDDVMNQINFPSYQRMYYYPGRILFMANAHDRKFWFPIIKKSYDEAMRAYKNSNI